MIEWREVVGWAGLYEVSSAGDVRTMPRVRRVRIGFRTIPGRIVHPTTDRNGYHVVALKDRGRRQNRFVHSLVLDAFVGPCPDGMQCRHFPDATRTNNRVENLAWGTAGENAADRVVHGTQARGGGHGIATLDPVRVVAVRLMAEEGASQTTIAAAFRVGRSTVQAVLTGRTWSHVVSDPERHAAALGLLAQVRG